MKELDFYYIDLKYIRDLAKVDDNVMSISPQRGKQNRPFAGVVILMNGRKYCIPLTSPKAKFKNKKSQVDLVIHDKDKPEVRIHKQLMQKQLKWCRDHVDTIENRANKVYDMVVNHPEKNRNLVKRSSKFDKLETILDKLLTKE